MDTTIVQADVMDWCKGYKGPKFHAILCDPPYELGFMGKDWDKTGIVFDPATWEALAEHLHPGGFGMAFASSRGWHRLAVAIEDAGLRIHPSIFGWVFGSGFPKATRIDTQIDKAAGAEREVIGEYQWPDGRPRNTATHKTKRNGIYSDIKADGAANDRSIERPATDLARAWEGHRYGLQAMKPALEPIIVFQKPYEGKPVESIVETGAGALNIDGARIEGVPHSGGEHGTQIYGSNGNYTPGPNALGNPQGRWPANFYVDEEAAARLGEQSGERNGGGNITAHPRDESMINFAQRQPHFNGFSDTGTAARFFFNVNRQIDEADPVMYQAKASRKERDAGMEARNNHPTIKPIDLTRWLATLLLPPVEYAPRRILVPFSGSGSEMIGAMLAGWEEIIGIEMEREYVEIARARLEHWAKGKKQIGFDLRPRP